MLGFLPPSSRATLLTVCGGRGHHAASGVQAAGERHQVDIRVLRQRRADLCARAQDEVGDAGRQSGLLEHVHQQDGGGGGELAGLEDEGVAGQQRRGHLPGGLQQRVVPGRDQGADPDRLVDHPADRVVAAGVDHPAGVGAGDAAVVAEAADDVVDVVLGLDQALAGVQGLGAGEGGLVPHQQVGRAQEQCTSLALGGPRPVALVEGLLVPRGSP